MNPKGDLKQGPAAETALILTAAGSSLRMGTGKKKEFEKIDRQTVLDKALSPFLNINSIKLIIITISESDKKSAMEIIDSINSDRTILFSRGGKSRQESVYNGLLRLCEYTPDNVLIHDAARPWIDADTIRRVILETEKTGACIPVIPLINTPKQIDDNGFISSHMDRSRIFGAQTPQGFRFGDILKAHELASEDSKVYPDDSEIYGKYHGRISTVEGNRNNIKITYKSDLE